MGSPLDVFLTADAEFFAGSLCAECLTGDMRRASPPRNPYRTSAPRASDAPTGTTDPDSSWNVAIKCFVLGWSFLRIAWSAVHGFDVEAFLALTVVGVVILSC